MVNFINKSVLHNHTVFYKELKVKHLKIIYKTLFGDEPDPETVFINFNNILTDITSLTEKEITCLNFIDYFLLLLDIRSVSIGNIIFAQLQDSEVDTKIEINISKIKEELFSILEKNVINNFETSNAKIYYKYPTLTDIVFINKENNIDYFYNCFLKSIKINNNKINFENLSVLEKNYIFEQLPPKITSTIIKDVVECIKNLNTTNLLTYLTQLKNISLSFNLNVKNLIMLLKFLFGDGLLSLYENIFALCKLGNLTPEYVENCTPGEYLLLIKKLEQLNSQNNNTQPTVDSIEEENLMNDGLDDLNPYKSPDMPPITSQSDLSNFAP